MSPPELILEPECRALTRLHPATRWRLEKRGLFPRRIKIGDPRAVNGRIAWSRSEVTEWLAERMAARSTDDTITAHERALVGKSAA